MLVYRFKHPVNVVGVSDLLSMLERSLLNPETEIQENEFKYCGLFLLKVSRRLHLFILHCN